MSTPRRRRAGGSPTSSNNTNSSSKAPPRKKVGTPGTKGVEFEAAVQADAGDPADTFSYEDVSDLETVTPAARRAELGMASKAVSIAARNGGGKRHEKVGSARKRQGAAQQQQQQQQQQQEARTGGKEEGGAAKRRKQRKQQQQQAAAAAEAAAATEPAAAEAAASAAAATAATAVPAESETTKTATPTGHGRTRPEHDIATNNSSSKRSSRENGVAGGGAGVELKEADGAGRGEGGEKTTGEAFRSGEKRKRTLSPKGQGAAMAKGQGKARGVRGGEVARPARKAPRYPEVALECSGRASNLGEALGEAVFVEVQGLIRKRGHEAACKAAVHACVDASKEIRRQAAGIGIDLDPPPQLDLKELRKMFAEERERQRALIREEERLWEAEEQKCLAIAEKTRRAKANLEGFDKKMKDGRLRRSGSEELRPLLELMGTGADGVHEEEKWEESSELSEGGGTAKRVSDQLLESTNDMLLNAGAIGRGLQEMGAVVADGQETKDSLVRVFRKHTFKNYPNVNDPKAGIAAMLK